MPSRQIEMSRIWQKLCEKGHHIKKYLLLSIYALVYEFICSLYTQNTHTHTNYQFSMSQTTERVCKHIFTTSIHPYTYLQWIKSANRLLSIQLYMMRKCFLTKQKLTYKKSWGVQTIPWNKILKYMRCRCCCIIKHY